MRNKDLRFIYGAGKYGKLLFHCLIELMEVDYFVQTEEPIEKELEGIPIISFDKMINMEGLKKVFIAIGDKKIAEEIERNIYKADSINIKVYRCGSFIADNLLSTNRPIVLKGNKHCNICQCNFEKFLPAGIHNEIFKRNHIIGGGYRENSKCPCCGSGDRQRWFYYVLQHKLNISEMSGRMLHFAPEKSIIEYIKQNKKIDYYTADIVGGRAMHVADITDIQFKDETFEYVICNHVMEHIVDEKKAVNEIMRVLKMNGKWIFSFPICTDIPTYEDAAISSPEARLKEYGQADHVRLYGYDYKTRFEKYGLEIQIFSPENEMDIVDIEKYGFIKDDVIIVATKKSGSVS